MANYVFSPSGVQQWQADLYALPDETLQEEALLITQDFAAWITATFALDPDQITFLTGMATSSLSYMAAQVTLAVVNRLPITLIKPEQKADAGVRGSKFIDSRDDLKNGSDGDGNARASGSVTFEVT